MAASLGISNGSATPNKTGKKGNVTNSSGNTSSGALSDGSTANPTATTVVQMFSDKNRGWWAMSPFT